MKLKHNTNTNNYDNTNRHFKLNWNTNNNKIKFTDEFNGKKQVKKQKTNEKLRLKNIQK